MSVHSRLDRLGGRAEQVVGGDRFGWLEKVGITASEMVFERCYPVEYRDTLVGRERGFDAEIEDVCEFIEQIVRLSLQITLIEISNHNVCLKRHIGEVSGESLTVFELPRTYGSCRERAEPVEVREQFCECYGRNLKKELSFFENVRAAVLAILYLCAAPTEQA